MKKVFFVLLLTGLSCTVTKTLAQAGDNLPETQILVTPQWLNDHLKDRNLVLLQVTFLKFEYDKEHIFGAQYLWPGWLAPDSPYGNYNAPDPNQTTKILCQLGISNDSRVVLYHIRSEVPVTARMFLTLENLGLQGRASFLNGGLDAWKQAGFTTTKDLLSAKKGNIKIKPGTVLVVKEYVLKDLNTQAGVVVDARKQHFL